MSDKTLEFWFDVGSPASYLAWTQLPRLAQETGARIDYRPMLLGGVFQAAGNQSPMAVEAKGRYVMMDFERFARRYGVEYRLNPHFPINTLMLMRGAAGLQMRDERRLAPYLAAVHHAIWVDGRNMNDPHVVTEILHDAGFDPEEFIALVSDPQVKDRLKALTQQAVERGVFGAPTFFVGTEMFWGQDRMDFIKEALLS